MNIEQINKKIEKMPPDLVSEVMDYIDYLMHKYAVVSKTNKSFDFSWEGGLSEISKEYTSVDLQHKVLEWR
ncbi:MAG: DUF2281 domain-containing protein [Melioribacteraceae bacterium]|nr:DUF2281 domain-containing protein [Melioribacteraceae bacterium]